MVKLGILSLDHPHSRGNHIPALRYLGKKLQVAAICTRTRRLHAHGLNSSARAGMPPVMSFWPTRTLRQCW